MQGEASQPGRWYGLLTRLLQAACLAITLAWVFGPLGGLRLSPVGTGEGHNDTSQLFNWHPLLATLAFPVLMAEALLSYRAPLPELKDRPQMKVWHLSLQTGALGCVVLAVVAAFYSHTLKLPDPIPNLYSVHSYLGMLTIVLFSLQYVVGVVAYVFPKFPSTKRQALSPLHKFFGRAIFVAGLATMAVGAQEKAAFLQAFQRANVSSAAMRLPAVLVLLLALTGGMVLYYHASVAPAGSPGRDVAALPVRTPSEAEPLRRS